MRVLVVEDEPGVAGFIEQGLSEAGYAVDVARDGEDGLEYALAADYDLLVLDIMLPRKSGLQLLEELRTRGDETPVLLLTARDAVEDRVKGLDAGAEVRETIREAHEASLRRRFTVLDDTEREHLDALLDSLRAGLYEKIEE